MVFWNKESVILKVREYQEAGQGSIVGVLDYEIVESMRSSLYLHWVDTFLSQLSIVAYWLNNSLIDKILYFIKGIFGVENSLYYL